MFLIYGHRGWIGQLVIAELERLHLDYVRGESRVEKIDEVRNELQTHNATHVICLIGRTHGTHNGHPYTTIDYLEQKGRIYDNVRDNLFSPIALAILCQSMNIHMTYMGTGCIFEYDHDHPFGREVNGFTEEDTPNFFGSSYSVVKGFTDQLMHLFPESVLNVRIRMPITHDLSSRNFITKITTYAKVCSVPNSMTVLPELIPIMIDMSLRKFGGTINLCNPGLISHNEILEMYQEIVDPSFTWKNFSIEEQNQILCAGRSNNYLDTTKLQELYPHVMDIKSSVRKSLQEIKKILSP